MFAFVKTHAWSEADAATREAFGELVEHLGDKVEEISIDYTTERGIAAAKTVQKVELAHHFGPLLDAGADLISQRLAEPIEEGRRVTGRRLSRRARRAQELYATVEDLLTQHGTDPDPGRARAGAQGPRTAPATPCSAASGPTSACRP